MDENTNNHYEDEIKPIEEKVAESDIDKEKKEKEINIKKKQPFHLDQSKDSSEESSDWGSFGIRSTESLEILEDETFYRTPVTNIIESNAEYYFLVELPGLDKKHVNITLQEEILEITGEISLKQKDEKEHKDKKEEKEKKEKKEEKKDKHKEKKDKKKEKHKEIKGDYLRREFRSASFYRSFQLPEEINTEGIDASFKKGVLRLTIPKKTVESSDKKVIEIK
ncbi:MAG: Hsp20/alpha crystallin family protein [Promethearchaeota archaeon]|jgi:HSP20 family protein